jgi:peptide/nickel transport system substrate-binding protein
MFKNGRTIRTREIDMNRPAPSLRLILLAALLLSGLLLFLAACGGDEEAADETAAETTEEGEAIPPVRGEGGDLVVNIAQAPSTLDPAWGCGLYDIGFVQNFYVRLTQYGSREGPDGTTQVDPSNIEPYFATSMDVSEDGRVYTFTLPEGATFPSGNPVDAEAVKYSLERSIEMNGCGTYFIYDGIYEPPLVESIETPDETTVVITLSRANPNFPQNLAQPAASIVDASVVEEHGGVAEGEINEYMASNVAGSGPYLLAEYEPNRRAVLERNPDFFGDPPASERIVVNWINSDPTLLLHARNGTADITIGMTKQAADNLRDDNCCRVVAHPATFWEYIGTPWDKEPWDNQQVREAVTYAVPYDQIIDQVAFGWAQPFYGPYAPEMNEFNEEIARPREFDMDRARQLMEESGVETPINVEMVIPEGNTQEEQIATIVQGTWRELGINITIRKLSATDYQNALQEHQAESFVRIDGPGVVEAGYLLGYDMKCGIGFNLSQICIPEADELLEEARQETDPDRRQELYDRIAELWVEHSPRVMVYADHFVTVLNQDVTNYHYAHIMDVRTWSK